MMRTATVAVLAALAALAPSATAAPTAAAVQDCIASNAPRYDNPANAVASQYIDIAAACRARLTEDDGATVAIAGGRLTQPPQGSTPTTTDRAEGASLAGEDRGGGLGDSARPSRQARDIGALRRSAEQAHPTSPVSIASLPVIGWAAILVAVAVVAVSGIAGRWQRRR